MSSSTRAGNATPRSSRIAARRAQLQREVIESASADESAATIDRNTLVHMLLSITTEQNLDSEFARDVPTEAEIAKLEREMPKMNLEEMLKYIERPRGHRAGGVVGAVGF